VNGILYLVYLVVVIYGWMIVARAVLSWLPVRPGTLTYESTASSSRRRRTRPLERRSSNDATNDSGHWRQPRARPRNC
jgi:hypothetical protein